MEPFFRRTLSVTKRVLRQLQHDKRLIGLSMIVPLAVIYILYIFFDSLNNPFLDVDAYVFPLGAYIVHFLTFVLTAIVIVRERTTETLPRMMVNGYRQLEIILGYLLAYTTLATAQSLLVMAEITWLFELDYGLATLASVYLVMWLLAVISMALGIFVSNFAHNEGQVFPFIPLVILPSMFLSGMIISVEALPEWAQVLSYFTPVLYSTDALKGIVAGGTLAEQGSAVMSLPLYGLVVLVLASFTLRDSE
jgi:ABC-2 type transport system permease protein